MINRVQNPSKMTFNVEVKMTKHPFLLVIKWFIIVTFIVFLMAIIPTILWEVFDNETIATTSIFIEIALLFIVIAILCRHKRGKDFMIMDDNLDTFIKNNKTNKQMSFNLLELYRNNYAKIINYTWSNTICIKIKKLYGYRVKITGDNNVRNYLVPRFRILGIQVLDIDDEPSDDD